MKFKSTGLPTDVKVFDAYRMWRTQCAQGKVPYDNGFDLGVAQILSHTEVQRDTLCLALLHRMPSSMDNDIGQKFGAHMKRAVRSMRRLEKNGYRDIHRAPEHLRVLTMASAYLFLYQYEYDALSTEKRLQETGSTHIVPNLDVKLYDTLVSRVVGTTSVPRLEQSLKKKLEETIPLYDRMLDTVRKLKGTEGRFEDSGLLNRPSVRVLYDELSLNDSVLPESFNAAVAAGRILSTVPKRKSAAEVAAALADIACGPFGENYPPPEKMGTRSSRVLGDRSLHTVTEPGDMKSSPAFARIVLADAIVRLDTQTRQSRKELKDKTFPLGYAFNNAAMLEREMYGVIKKGAEAAECPELEKLFARKLRNFSRLLNPYRPEVPRLPQQAGAQKMAP
jgi:hypothetical protein